MSPSRRDFLKTAAVAGVAVPGIVEGQDSDQPPGTLQACDAGKSVHSVLEEDHPYVYIDSCMQMWPDGDFHLAHRHGVTAYAVTAWRPHFDAAAALDGMMYWHAIAREQEGLEVVRTAADLPRLKREGKAGLLLASQCGDFVGYDLSRVQAFQEAGLRMLNLVYSANNHLGGGCLDRADGGLSLLGQRVVEECNRVGIVIDLSHTGHTTTLEIIDHSAQPVVFSHSNAAALVPSVRNISDEEIRACASRGGVIGLVSWGPLVLKPDMTQRPTLDDFFEHIDHVAQLTGSAEHIGVGTDMSIGTYPIYERDPFGAPAYTAFTARYNELVTSDVRSPMRNIEGFSDYAEIAGVAERLLEHGYSDEDVGNILGGNFLRVFEEVWA